MANYTVGMLPIVGYYQFKGQRYIIDGKEIGSHAALYSYVANRVRSEVYRIIVHQAIGIGYMMQRVGWDGILAAPQDCPVEANQLMQFMKELGGVKYGTQYMLRFDGHAVRWTGGPAGIACSIDGWDVPFNAVKMRHFFKRMKEEA